MHTERPCDRPEDVQVGDRVRLNVTHSLAGQGLLHVEKVEDQGITVKDANQATYVIPFESIACVIESHSPSMT